MRTFNIQYQSQSYIQDLENRLLLNNKHPLIVISQEFAQLCKPLELLQIQHLTFISQLHDGTRMCLSNKPKWVEEYYNLKLFQSSLFESTPNEMKPNYQLWIGDYDLDVYHHGKLYYKTCDAISITEPHSTGCEHYIFSAHVDNKWLMPHLINNMDILFHFIMYLKDKGKHLFEKSSKSGVKVQEALLNPARVDPVIDKFTLENLKLQQSEFIAQTPIEKMIIEMSKGDSIKLSRQEIICLTHLNHNRTAKEIAVIMQISYRTVEAYLENIRLKLRCESKSALIEKIKTNKYLMALNR